MGFLALLNTSVSILHVEHSWELLTKSAVGTAQSDDVGLSQHSPVDVGPFMPKLCWQVSGDTDEQQAGEWWMVECITGNVRVHSS